MQLPNAGNQLCSSSLHCLQDLNAFRVRSAGQRLNKCNLITAFYNPDVSKVEIHHLSTCKLCQNDDPAVSLPRRFLQTNYHKDSSRNTCIIFEKGKGFAHLE